MSPCKNITLRGIHLTAASHLLGKAKFDCANAHGSASGVVPTSCLKPDDEISALRSPLKTDERVGQGAAPPGYAVIAELSDEFDGDRLDETKWSADPKKEGWKVAWAILSFRRPSCISFVKNSDSPPTKTHEGI